MNNISVKILDRSDPLLDLFEKHSCISLPSSLQSAPLSRQRKYKAGRICAAEAMYDILGTYYYPEMNADGSPSFPPNVFGSITHSGPLSVAAVGRQGIYKGIGVDIENTQVSVETLNALDEIIVSTEEKALLKLDPSNPYEKNLIAFFGLKESLFKAIYPLGKVLFDFRDVEIIHFSKSRDSLEIEVKKNIGGPFLKGSRYLINMSISYRDNYQLTLVWF